MSDPYGTPQDDPYRATPWSEPEDRPTQPAPGVPQQPPVPPAQPGPAWTPPASSPPGPAYPPTQSFPPPPPYSGPTGKDFVPFGVGYVELPGEVKVESRLTECDPAVLANGMEMELVIVPFRTDDDGNEVVTFAFRPVA